MAAKKSKFTEFRGSHTIRVSAGLWSWIQSKQKSPRDVPDRVLRKELGFPERPDFRTNKGASNGRTNTS